jgi:MoxR-like ATPase
MPGTTEVVNKIKETNALCKDLISEVENTILGKRNVLEHIMVDILAGGNILFEDYPGLAKTLMANTFAKALGCKFQRIQFTPDLLPSDITGTYVFNPKTNTFNFHAGPIFTNILLADEINRAPPKTQAALLEAMQEKQVTVEGNTHKLPEPFFVFATQNPIEYEGTYPLPEAQLDRFMMKLSVGYPDFEVEKEIVLRRHKRSHDDVPVDAVTDTTQVLKMQQSLEFIHFDERLIDYLTRVIHLTRSHPMVEVGSSPRGTLALYKLARAVAVLSGRHYVLPDDVKLIAISALKHRIILKPEPRIRGVKPEDIISEILMQVPVPSGDE